MSMEEPSQFSMGQTALSLSCSIMEKLHTGLDECPRILLSCFRARNSGIMAKQSTARNFRPSNLGPKIWGDRRSIGHGR